MDEGKFAAEFFSANLEKIFNIATKAFGKADSLLQLKLKTAYTDFLNLTRLKYSKSKSFFIHNQPVELYSYYVPTGISCGKRIIKRPTFKYCTEFTKRILISGTGGSGKSVLMKHLFLDCISNKEFVPILIELRDLNSSQKKTINQFINETLKTYGFDLSTEYVEKAMVYGHFSFFFDGFDEINPKNRNKIIRQILLLSKKYTKCPIFLSSRPDDVLSGLEDFSIFEMRSLELDEALSLVAKLPFEEIIKARFSEDLSNGLFEKHKSFLSNPLLLSIMLLTYGENAEIPSKLSIFYYQAYEALFQRHDAYKGAFSRARLTSLDIQDFSKVFSLFCLQTYEQRLLKMSRTQCLGFIKKGLENLDFEIKPEDFLQDLMSAVCLLIEDGLEIAFSHRSFQEYFVALQISNCSPEIQNKLIDRYWKQIQFDNVMNLLREINPDLVERELFVPKLAELFQEIGVIKKVNITHVVKYIKYLYESILIDDKSILFSLSGKPFSGSRNSNDKVSLNILLHIVVHNYSNYVATITNNYMQERQEIIKLYGNEEEQEEYSTKDLTIKSPLLIDLLKVKIIDMNFIAAAFEAYKMLKHKHMNAEQNFDILLGIK